MQLKFVITRAEDVTEAAEVVSSIESPLKPERILVMPEGITSAELREKNELLVSVCKQRGWRYSPRLHVDLFGNQRGT